VLVLSTDPAHSLGDALEVAIGPRPRRIRTRAGRLDAVELDAPRAVARWLETRRPALSRLMDEGTLLDREDISQILGLPLPGIDELAAFLALAGFEQARHYDAVVLDTAPTGHTLRLLEMPRLVGRVVALLEAMSERRAAVARALGGRVSAVTLIEELRRDASAVEARLRSHALFSWVTLPEPVTVRETIAGLEWLRGRGYPVAEIVVNRMTPEPSSPCAECGARIADERAALIELARVARAVPFRAIARQAREPRGAVALRRIADELKAARSWPALVRKGEWKRRSARPYRGPVPEGRRPELPLEVSVRLLLFGGKGGVGKTTCAAAAAVAAAAAHPDRTIRLVSTDPAPSLGAVLQMTIGDGWRRVRGRGHLEARELDAAAIFHRHRQRYRTMVGEVFDAVRGDSVFEARADRAIFERLFDLAPPGVDEMMGLLSVLDLSADRAGDLVIVDTAPSGHTLRLLAQPADMQEWVAVLMRLVLKYRLAARAEPAARDLLALSRAIRGFRTRLADPAQTSFVAVARPAVLPLLETGRFLAEVRRLRIPTSAVVLNAPTGGKCPSCRAAARAEAREAGRLTRLCADRPRRSGLRGCAIIHAPLQVPPPRGARDLLNWSRAWRVQP
jgi:arsenite-transporting ATPase